MISLLRMFSFLKKYRLSMTGSFFLLVISVALNLSQPKLVELVIDYGIKAGKFDLTLLGALGILVAAIIGFTFHFASGYLLIGASQGMAYDIRNNLYNKLMSLPFTSLDRWRTGELMVRMNSDVTTIMMFIRMGFFMIIQSVCMITGSLIIMFLTNARLATIMAVIMPSTLLLFFIVATLIRPVFMKVREKLDNLNNMLQENLAGAKVVRAFAGQSSEIDRFEEKNRDFLSQSLKVGYIISFLFPVLHLAGQLALTATLWVGGTLVIENFLSQQSRGLSLGQLVAFNNYALLAMFPIIMLGMVLSFISMAAASATRIEDLLKEPSRRPEIDHEQSMKRIEGSIEFRNVSFHYGDGENALTDISLTITPGQRIGIIGTTGAGKSSLVHLIPLFYEPCEGEILIDGIDNRNLTFETLRTRISVVLQETMLFSGTIRDNIAFGRPEADNAEIERAAEVACARDFILEKEHAWDEPVGERGAGLSGGQRQRIAIARAVLSQPDIIILDDVTSSVDIETENRLIDNLYNEFAEKTAIIISQKINTIKNSDNIVVVDRGKIAGRGTHEELLAENEIYREIATTQTSLLQL
ncbi:MAG: ABC transporter ATP-binding protein [Spirochaetales bacterium]|nr:ABC transporter ATP-binding protein [Spirochaetales bacterium]